MIVRGSLWAKLLKIRRCTFGGESAIRSGLKMPRSRAERPLESTIEPVTMPMIVRRFVERHIAFKRKILA